MSSWLNPDPTTIAAALENIREYQLDCRPSIRRTLARRLGPSVSRYVVEMSIAKAEPLLKEARPQTILIDNSVLAHRHASYTGSWYQAFAWPSNDRRPTPPLAQEASEFGGRFGRSKESKFDILENRQYLYGITLLARRSLIDLVTSHELIEERMPQPIGRYGTKHIFEEDIFEGVQIGHVDTSDPFFSTLPDPAWRKRVYCARCDLTRVVDLQTCGRCDTCDGRWIDAQRKERFDRKLSRPRMGPPPQGAAGPAWENFLGKARLAEERDQRYRELVGLLKPGRRENWDLFHVATAEVHNHDCFMTMDRALVLKLRQKRRKPIELQTDVLTPYEWGRKWSLRPIEVPGLIGEIAGKRQPNPWFDWSRVPLSPDEAMSR